MPRKYQRRRTGVNPDPVQRREDEHVERFLEGMSAAAVAIQQQNFPGAVIRVDAANPGNTGLIDHDHSRSGFGGSTLGDPSRNITGRGLWEWDISGKLGVNKVSPQNRLHVVGPDNAFISYSPSGSQIPDDAPLNWQDQGGGTGTSIFAVLGDGDETVTHIHNTGLNSATAKCLIDPVVDPGTDIGWRVRVVLSRDTGSSDNQNIFWSLVQGPSTAISDETHSLIGVNTATEFITLLTAAEVVNITTFADLRFEIIGGGSGGQDGPHVYQIQLQAPSGAGGEEDVVIIEGGVDQTKPLLKFQDNALNSVGIKLPDTLASYDITLPPAVGAPLTFLMDVAGDGVTTWDTGTNLDHGALGGLTDDDHSQYFLLAGRTGPAQVAIGGTASGDDLTLQSTSNATRGDIIFGSAGGSRYQENLDRWALNKASALAVLDVDAESGTVPAITADLTTDVEETTDGTVVLITSDRSDVALNNGVQRNRTLVVNARVDDGYFTTIGTEGVAVDVEMDYTPFPSFNPNTDQVGALKFLAKTTGAPGNTNIALPGGLFGITGRVDHTHTGSGLLARMTAFNAVIASTGTVTQSNGIKFTGTFSGATLGTINWFNAKNPTLISGATLVTQRGVYLQALTGATTNWAIYSEGADSWFQDRVRTSAALRLIEAGGTDSADYVEIKAPTTVGTSYGIELDDNGPSNDTVAKFAALSSAVTVQTFVDIPLGQDFIPASNFVVASGTPTEGLIGSYPDNYNAWSLLTAALEAVTASWQVPQDYQAATSLTYKAVYTESTSEASNWVGEINVLSVASGESAEGASNVVNATIAGQSSTTNTGIATIGSSSTGVAAGEWIRVAFERTGTSGSDVHAGDIQFIGLIIEYEREI